MSLRSAKKPLEILSGVKIEIKDNKVNMQGKIGDLSMDLNDAVVVEHTDNNLSVKPANDTKFSKAMTGTTYALLKNMMIGVSQGFTKVLKLIGVGYRAKVEGSNTLKLSLGYSHDVIFQVPTSLQVKCPSQTEIELTGADKQIVGEVAAKIRSKRPPEPYKGKGVRYDKEHVNMKEAKKK